ncbi:MAG: CBS domain-containing protein [Alphaproteobacteria bacterium]|nr:MAG: CBS domain-containing protein [Alphaproteobacteria bacterium]
MFVHQILGTKKSRDVLTVRPDASVSEAARLLSEHRIGALVVSADGRSVAGMFSERDIVRELGRRGSACLNDRVSDLMTSDVKTCSLNDRADQILTTMTEGRFRHLPVMEDDRLVGVISIGDVVAARLKEIEGEKIALEDMIRGY